MRETYQVGPGQTVTVTIEASDAPATGERLYTAREVVDLQASEAELVSAPLRRKLAETERELARRTEERERARAGQEARVRELERLLALRLAQMAQEKREAVTALAEKLGQVAGAVHSPEIVDALARLEPAEADYVLRLAHAVRSVRTIVGSPSLPATPDGPTSQA